MDPHSQTLVNNEIAEITTKIKALDAIRAKLEQDLLKLQEEELELDDECKYLLALPIQLASHSALQWKEFRSVWSLRVPRKNLKRVRAIIYLRALGEERACVLAFRASRAASLASHSWWAAEIDQKNEHRN
jgi:hypothetical protein